MNLDGWPNRDASRFVRAAGLRWHVQVMGAGPPLLLLHGTGAATHSWRGVMPLLAPYCTVIAPDLPGHGATESPAAARLSLPGMARALQGLLQIMDVRPVAAAGHSAGAAIVARMGLDGAIAPEATISLNGAFLPLVGVQARLFSPLARVLAGLPGLPQLFAWQAGRPGSVKQLLASTGSVLDDEGVALYARLVAQPGHVAAALGMMAHWDLVPLVQELPRWRTRLLLVAGAHDRSVPPIQSTQVAAMVPGARLVTLPGLGHLAHEEQPAQVASLILEHAGL